MRRTCDEDVCNVSYRWFLGFSIEEIPNYSTWSQNNICRYHDSSVFEEILYTILQQAIDYGFVDTKVAFGVVLPIKTKVKTLANNEYFRCLFFFVYEVKKCGKLKNNTKD